MDPLQNNFSEAEKEKEKKREKITFFFSFYGNGDTTHIGQEIQCLPYEGFYFVFQWNVTEFIKDLNPQNSSVYLISGMTR